MKRSDSQSERRRGFTLLELLVVVGIIAVLLAMLVPAVQKLREVANRTRCVNNLHQIGLAMTSHFGTHQSFPTNGFVLPPNGIRYSGPPTIYYQYGLTSFPGGPAPYTYMWGMGDPTQGSKTQTGSWAYALLPYMEETNTYGSDSRLYGANNPANYSNAVLLFNCPSRGRQNPQPNGGTDSFNWFYNQSWTPPPNPPASWQPTSPASTPLPDVRWSKTDYAANYLMIPDATDPRFYPPIGTGLRPWRGSRNYPITPADITDGAANTIVVGEKALPVTAYDSGGWYWDEPIFAGGSGGTARGVPSQVMPCTTNLDPSLPFYSQSQGFPAGPPPTGPAFNYPSGLLSDSVSSLGTFENNWGSPHPGGVNFLFADGSVRTFNYNVDPGLFQGLLTPAGSDPTPEG
jgi:prepilin-type N-terminal cleavage/methylation domain-containing protein/prepilin-type processing-associated H-X9-DG protein